MQDKARYIIGIDLGTTNSSVAYIDTDIALNPRLSVQSLRLPQLSAEGFAEGGTTLPSFCYICPGQNFALPWIADRDYVVGKLALAQGADTPTRLVQSAKSWLCNTACNRRDKLLPIEACDNSLKLSPVEASARYLGHIREAWNHVMRQGDSLREFEQQDIILTVPASFDEVARSLTVEAARLAGFTKMTLLEEPQAAFYSWIAQSEASSKTAPHASTSALGKNKLQPGQRILVCDVGGGTTDFSMIEVLENSGKLAFQRMAVGDHLLLGGDNMDTTLAHALEGKLRANSPVELSTTQWLQLQQHARKAKESLIGQLIPSRAAKPASQGSEEHPNPLYRVFLQGSGASVVQGSAACEISYSELSKILLDGFFGQYTWEEALQLRKTSGFRAMGLPYEDEPSITKQLARFIAQNKLSAPDFILFNGGALKPQIFQDALTNSLNRWFPSVKIEILDSFDLDLAVSRGAAYFGKARRGLGIRIGGGAACGYYLKVDIKGAPQSQVQDGSEQDGPVQAPPSPGTLVQKALALLPRGSEEGSTYEPDCTFWLSPNTPVAFHLYSSHVRLHDKSGDLILIDPLELKALPPIHTILRYGKGNDAGKIPVHLGIRLTEIGTLEMWLASQKTTHRWSLEFQLRAASGEENALASLEKGRSDETFDAGHLLSAQTALEDAFGGSRSLKPENIMEKLEELLDLNRKEWPPSALRGLWPALLKQAPHRKLSPKLEARWWNIAGYLLRPGFGYPLDDFRVKELWKVILGDLKNQQANLAQASDVDLQIWICYRRIAGGLSKGQQMQLASCIFPTLINKKNGNIEIPGTKELYAFSEKVRTLASMELIDHAMKVKLGNALVLRIAAGKAQDWEYWAMSRIGARHLIYGSLSCIIHRQTCSQWIEKIVSSPDIDRVRAGHLLGSLARKTGQREYDLTESQLRAVVQCLQGHPQQQRLEELIYRETTLTYEEQNKQFGENLPAGLMLES